MITLSQSGVFASSRSASHTLAPEFSALIVIFRSVGPVISTRRSTSPGAGAATRQAGSSRIWRVSGRKSSVPPADSSTCRVSRAASSSRPPRAELALQRGQQAQRVRGEDLVVPVPPRAGDLDTLDSSHVTLLPVMITSWARVADGGTDANSRP